MEWYEWVFDGIGTAVISIICSFISYKAAVKKMAKQSQIAGDESRQKQEMVIEDSESNHDGQSSIKQIQRAGNNSEQVQCGGIKRG